jgi:peroxiredoxin Q/BCP
VERKSLPTARGNNYEEVSRVTVKIGNKAPAFSLPNQEDRKVNLKDFSGKWVALYFYPKDNTSGCSIEAQEFTSLQKNFESNGAVILGVSADSVTAHQNFADKKQLGITLLSDSLKKTIEKYHVWQKKKMAGREYMGIVRTTYLIDSRGRVAEVWEKVKAKGHAEEVLARLKELRAGK